MTSLSVFKIDWLVNSLSLPLFGITMRVAMIHVTLSATLLYNVPYHAFYSALYNAIDLGSRYCLSSLQGLHLPPLLCFAKRC